MTEIVIGAASHALAAGAIGFDPDHRGLKTVQRCRRRVAPNGTASAGGGLVPDPNRRITRTKNVVEAGNAIDAAGDRRRRIAERVERYLEALQHDVAVARIGQAGC